MPAYYDEKNKQWRFRKQITLLDGSKKRISGTPAINTKVAAEAAEDAEIDRWLHPEKAQYRAQLAESNDSKAECPTFKAYAPSVIDTYRPRGKRAGADSWQRSLAIAINGPVMRFFGPYRLDRIDQQLVDQALKHPEWKGKADQTINNRLSALSIVLDYAHRFGKHIAKPELELRVESRTINTDSDEVEAVERADVGKLLAVAGDPKNAFPYWARVAILLAAEAGLRIGEIRAVQWTDIGKDDVLTVRRSLSDLDTLGPPKNGKKREVPLSPRLVAELRKVPRLGFYICARDGKKHGGKNVRYKPMLNAIRRCYLLARVVMPRSPKTRQARPWHGLRHTFGTTLAAAGCPMSTLMELMGHADIRTTMIYVNPGSGPKAAAIAEAFG